MTLMTLSVELKYCPPLILEPTNSTIPSPAIEVWISSKSSSLRASKLTAQYVPETLF